jgi:hypothetical protein
MPLVSTMPEKGGQAKVYDIPDADLAKYETVEATKGTYDEAKDKIAGAKELAGGVDLDKADVKAYSDIYICYFWWRGVLYYRWCYSWQECP